MIVQPFGFLQGAAGGGAVFDPTLGGTISPYFWYDFTDSSTMTFSSGNNITAIASKGSNTGDIAQGTGTKYTTSWIAPTWEGDYTQFYGNDGATTYNSSLSRRYSSDGTNGKDDVPFEYASAMTAIVFGSVNFSPTPVPAENIYYLISIKDYNMTNTGYDEFNVFGVNTWTGITGTWTFSWLSTDTTKYPVYMSHALRASNQVTAYSMNGVSPADTGWFSMVTKLGTGSDGGEVQRASGEVKDYGTDRPRSYAGTTTNENFTIGNRARNSALGSYPFKLKHVIIYDAELSDTEIEDVRVSYNGAYPGDSLNSITN